MKISAAESPEDTALRRAAGDLPTPPPATDLAAKRLERLKKANKGNCNDAEHKRRVAAYERGIVDGLRVTDIARSLSVEPRRFYEWVWRHYPSQRHAGRAVTQRAREGELPPGHTMRTCLGAGCGKAFVSAGVGNRLCPYCRQRAGETYSPYAPDPGGDTGRQRRAVRS
jgi:hypothetical protein